MSPASQHSIFSKSNLVYIPLSITIAHALNFIVNNPLSIWKEFPPKLPNSVYSSIFYTPLLLFISLTFEPIQTRKRFYILLSLALLYISIPISFRKYPSDLNNILAFSAVQHGLKMILFLKYNRAYLNQNKSDQKKEFKPYLWSLFNWRINSEKENPLIIKSPTISQINQKIISRLMIMFPKWLIYELIYFISINYMIETQEDAYRTRLMRFFTTGILPVTMTLMLKYVTFIALLYTCGSLYYDFFTVFITIIFRFFYTSSEKNDHKPILIQLRILTPSEYVSLNEWLISFIFNTKHLFSEPWMASSPRDFWSNRWQLLLNEIFKELGYLPIKNLVVSFVPKKVANIMGVLGAFGVSALLHEYLIIAQFNIWTGDQFFFFIMHGIVLILWEAVFGYENKNKNTTKIKTFLMWVLLAFINSLLLPAFVEPMKIQYCSMPSYFTQDCKVI